MRLIDAENFLKAMKDYFAYMVTHNKYNVDCIDCNANLQHLLDNQQTAYDIDKAVEELEENASRYTKKYITPYGNNGYRDTKAISIHKAIKIVKQGCVAVANDTTIRDDVCEWKYKHPFGDFPGCKNLNYSISRDSNWKYCPYCGKKIKIVGD